MQRKLQLRKGGHNAGADLEKLCEPVSHMEMPLTLSGFPESFFLVLNEWGSRPYETKKPITQAGKLDMIGF